MFSAPSGDHVWEPASPEGLASSRIWAEGGYLVVPGLIGPDLLGALRAEAEHVRPGGERATVAGSDDTEGRGGSPARAFRSAPGGTMHWGLHGSPQMAEALSQICNIAIAATGGGTYSFYEQEGDFLALHRDVIGCDIATITCLFQGHPDRMAGGLLAYPNYFRRTLSEVRAAGREAGVRVSLDPGETVILLGGLVPHEVTPAAAGQDRIVAINCYRFRETG
jgi:hypothetical protein